MARHGALVVGLLLVASCDGDGSGRSASNAGAGGKADATQTADPNRSSHWNAVEACQVAAVEDVGKDSDAMATQDALAACVAEANDAVWPVLLKQLPSRIRDEYTGEPVATTADDVERYVKRVRASQGQACTVLGVVMGEGDEEDTEVAHATCLAQAEIHTANLLDAHVDMDFPKLEIRNRTERHGRCVQVFDRAVEDGPPDPNDMPDWADAEEPLTEDAWAIAVRYELRDCVKGEDAELRVGWSEAWGEYGEHADEPFSASLQHVTAGMERESEASRLLCELLAQADRGEGDLTAAQCSADAAMQLGALVDKLALVFDGADPEDPEGKDPGDEPTPPTNMPAEGQVCYPGPDGDNTVCLPLVFPTTTPDGYEYPAALGGSANYRRPVGFIDLDAVDTSLRLSANFILGEFVHRDKGRYAIVQPHAVASLQRLRDEVGSISVNSAYRSPSYNDGIGGATHSRHMFGDGFDLHPNDVALKTLEDACEAGGGFLVEYTAHVHCDFRFAELDVVFFGPQP